MLFRYSLTKSLHLNKSLTLYLLTFFLLDFRNDNIFDFHTFLANNMQMDYVDMHDLHFVYLNPIIFIRTRFLEISVNRFWTIFSWNVYNLCDFQILISFCKHNSWWTDQKINIKICIFWCFFSVYIRKHFIYGFDVKIQIFLLQRFSR